MAREYPIQGSVDLGNGKYAYIVQVNNFDEVGDLVDGIETLLTTLNGYVDGLEGISTTISGNVDQLETIATAISNTATSINNNVDTLEALTTTVRDYLKPPSGISDGVKNVTAAATRETLVAVATPCRKVIITAKDTNTGVICVGGATVVALAGATRRGTPLLASESVTLEIDDLNKINLDATVSGDGVTFTAVAA